jgi:hypothetical protein
MVLALTAFVIQGLEAQTKFILNPEIGIQTSRLKASGDLDESSLFPNQEIDYSSIFSYNGGVNFGVQFGGHWSIMTGVKFNRKGGRVTIEARDPQNAFPILQPDGTVVGDLGEITRTSTHNWLSIPVLAGAEFGNNLKVGLGIGPQFNIGLGEYKIVTEYNLDNNNFPTEENTDEFGDGASNVYKSSHTSLLVIPYVSYQLNQQSSIRFTLMIESGSDMVNENLVVGTANGSRNVSGTLKNNQFGISIGYVHTFDINAGVKY